MLGCALPTPLGLEGETDDAEGDASSQGGGPCARHIGHGLRASSGALQVRKQRHRDVISDLPKVTQPGRGSHSAQLQSPQSCPSTRLRPLPCPLPHSSCCAKMPPAGIWARWHPGGSRGLWPYPPVPPARTCCLSPPTCTPGHEAPPGTILRTPLPLLPLTPPSQAP